MPIGEDFDTLPDDERLYGSIEHWNAEKIEADEGMHADGEIEAFVHPQTGTAARIIQGSEGDYSVQGSCGGYSDFDNVVQSDDPSTMVSGSASVIALEIDSLADARAVAFYWMRGWAERNSTIGTDEGDIIDSERHNDLGALFG